MHNQKKKTLSCNRYTTLPRNLLSSAHALVEDFETIGDFTVEGSSSAAADTTNFLHGSQSIQLTTPIGAQGYINKVFSPPLDFSATPVIRLYFYIADKTKMNGGALLMSHSASNYTNGFQYTSFSSGAMRNGWNFRNIPKADFATMGSGSWSSTIAQIRWRATGAGGQQAVLSWDYMTAGVLGKPVVCISFDDGFASVFTYAFPAMLAHKIRGTSYVISDLIGSGGKMTAAQLAALYSAGWDIANHTKDHVNLTTLSQADAQTDIAACTTVLNGLGFNRSSLHLAYPTGAYNATVKAAATAAGILTARPTTEASQGYEILPLRDLLAVNPYLSLSDTHSLATIETQLDTTIAKGGVLILYGHELVTGVPAGEQWTVADFQALIAYIASHHVQCVTVSELYSLLSGPVRVPKVK